MLYPAQIWDCCCATVGQGECFPSPDNAEAPPGLLRSEPPQDPLRICSDRYGPEQLGLPGTSVRSEACFCYPCARLSTASEQLLFTSYRPSAYPSSLLHLPRSPPNLLHCQHILPEIELPAATVQSGTGRPFQTPTPSSPTNQVLQKCFMTYSQHSGPKQSVGSSDCTQWCS